MNIQVSPQLAVQKPTRVRYGVLGLACSLSMITYLDRVCFGSVAGFIQREFGLDDGEKGYLFAAFALAYAAFEVPSGWLGDVFGPRRTLIRIVLWWSVFTALTGLIWPMPGWTYLCFWAMVAVRFCFGMGEAGAYPNIARAFHNWFPIDQRGFAKGAVWMAGRLMGGATPIIVNTLIFTAVAADAAPAGAVNVISQGFNGSLAQVGAATTVFPVQVHWRHTFWIFGVLGVAWCTIFWWWFRDRPEQNPSVNAAELALIRAGKVIHAGPTDRRVPWLRLMSSGNLWLLCGAYFCSSFGWYFNITYMPGYLKEVYPETQRMSALESGLLAGAPLLLGSVACIVGGLMTDAFVRRTGNRKWGRRIFGVVGKGMCGTFYLASIFAPNVYAFVFCIAVGTFWNDMTMGAAWASCLDIGRKYSGIVAGCMNTIGNLGGFVAGISTGQVLKHFAEGNDKTLAWQINFGSFAAVYFAAVFLWLFFDSTKPLTDED